MAERYRVGEVFEDFDAALAARPTAAVICVPAHLHVAMATRLAQAGVHTLIEKPLGTALDGVGALQQLVDRQGTVAAVGYVLRRTRS